MGPFRLRAGKGRGASEGDHSWGDNLGLSTRTMAELEGRQSTRAEGSHQHAIINVNHYVINVSARWERSRRKRDRGSGTRHGIALA